MRKRGHISFRQLCLVATEQLATDPTLLEDQAEWKAAVKDRVHQLGFVTPMGDIVGRALDASESAHMKRRAPPTPPASPDRSRRDDAPPGWSARRMVRSRSAPSEQDWDGPELPRPLRTDPMTPLMSAMPSWLSTRLKAHASKP